VLRKKIGVYFAAALSTNVNNILALPPQVMPSWGKVRIVDGDSIRTASAAKDRELERDSSHFRVREFPFLYIQFSVFKSISVRTPSSKRRAACVG
jgi:hypothetical protein